MIKIRNFSIIAHIDHGKTTLSDRLIERCCNLSKREMHDQMLDTMDLERERGITIKSQFVRLIHKNAKGEEFILNLIDTPGHIDFTYEVSRSLSACDGALVVVDATQGIEAQTLTNTYIAMENDLTLIPIINKIDLPNTDIERTLSQIDAILGFGQDEAIMVSAKTGAGIEDLLTAIVERIPPPRGDADGPLKALIFDSWFDSYRGVVILVRVIDGVLSRGEKIKFLSNGAVYEVSEIGFNTPKPEKTNKIAAGEVAYVIASIKNIHEVKTGDTITHVKEENIEALPGFKEPQPMVFAGFYPTRGTTHEELRESIEKLYLNDSSLVFEPESSPALGIGFRLGFLGLLHKDIIQERLEREYNLAIITTSPSVKYQIITTKDEIIEIESPAHLPPPQQVEEIREPYVEATIITPDSYLGKILKLLQGRRGIHKKMEHISPLRVQITYELPLAEILYDFFDKLKSISQGYASFDYEILEYRTSPLIKLDILINQEAVDALSLIVHKDKAFHIGNRLTSRMKALIPRQLFEVIIQAAIGKRVIARTVVKALRKNVLAKCYGGDITRKMKLLKKQKEGKKRMKRIGRVDIPQEAFHAALELED
jgi:GTP-binding protein LepA